MRPVRAVVLGCALGVGAVAVLAWPGEAAAQPPCCYQRCEHVGPIRRCLRRIFHCHKARPCPPPAVFVPVVPAAPAPVVVTPAPQPFLPPSPAPVIPPRPAADLGTPLPPPGAGPMPPALGSSLSRPAPPLTPPTPPPPVRLESLASTGGARLHGQVVLAGAPRPHAELMLVPVNRAVRRQTVRADAAGRFDVAVAPGTWLVYTHGADGRPVYRGRVELEPHTAAKVTVRER